MKKLIITLIVLLGFGGLLPASTLYTYNNAGVTTSEVCWVNPTGSGIIHELVIFNHGDYDVYVGFGSVSTGGAPIPAGEAMGFNNLKGVNRFALSQQPRLQL